MFKEIIKEMDWFGKKLTLKTGKIARQADGAVLASLGDTVILCTVVAAKEAKEGIDFFPLTVTYREMSYAAGRIPGGFFKREGKPSEKEVLTSRLIDRPIRPLFGKTFPFETQVVCTVLSHDNKASSEVLAIVGTSAALAISGLPYEHVIAAAKVGHINGQLVINPSHEELSNSKLDLMIAGTRDSVMMVESEASELTEEQMLEALEFGHKAFVPVIDLIKEFEAEASKEKREMVKSNQEALIKSLEAEYSKRIAAAYAIRSKQERGGELHALKVEAVEKFADGENVTETTVKKCLEQVESHYVRSMALDQKVRIDGRSLTDIRNIECEVSLLPKAHGSSLFTRGETQTLVAATLGTGQDEQLIDGLEGESRERFMLHYNFPPYSVGEAAPLKPPGRREIGHGKLAWRALKAAMPSKEAFPYTVRAVSEVTESNGSSSMATVCGTSLALMDAGVPLSSPVAGIAMGLIKEGNKFAVLSDILGDEDHLGDMDFKVAGTEKGITALQMDIKITGINFDIMNTALTQAKDGRMHILNIMKNVISEGRDEVSQHAPSFTHIQIKTDQIREVIGSGGKVIKEICEKSGAKIDISDQGLITVATTSPESKEIAVSMIMAIVALPETGKVYEGKVVKVIDAGAFVNIMGNKDGFVHISEIADEKINKVSDHLKENDQVKVKVIGTDDRGKTRLSIRQVNQATGEVLEVTVRSKPKSDGPRPNNSHNKENNNSYNKENKRPAAEEKPKKEAPQTKTSIIKKFFG